MAKLIKILLVCFVPLILLVYLFPIEKERMYASLELDCTNRGVWMYDRLYNNQLPIDLAFIGSSHTINAITEKRIQQSANCGALNIVNLGYCRMGRNMSYVLLKEILENKSVKSLVLEVREDEDRYSHPVFPFLADSRDVLGASLLFNKDFLVDNWDHFAYRCQLIQETVFGHLIPKVKESSDFGFMANVDTLPIKEALAVKEERISVIQEQGELARRFYIHYPRSYLQQISELCRQHQIQLYFLYLPGYGSEVVQPIETGVYSTLGTLLLPPAELLNDRDNWHDPNHFNIGGAGRLSDWLGSRLDCSGTFRE